jgi:hypothetical protein
VEARRRQADARAADLAPTIADIRRGGVTSLRGIAMALNARGVSTATGKGRWEIPQVRRTLARLA